VDNLVVDSTNGSPLGTKLTLNGSFNTAALSIGANQTVAMANAGGALRVLTIGSLSLNAAAKLDLGKNELLVTATPATVLGYLKSGQIFTSSTGGALGYVPVGASQTEVRFTLRGDTNLDGHVDVTDLGNFASNYGRASGATWASGDFNGDGAINVTDLGDLASAYGGTVSLSASAAAITPVQSSNVAATAPSSDRKAVASPAASPTNIGFANGTAASVFSSGARIVDIIAGENDRLVALTGLEARAEME